MEKKGNIREKDDVGFLNRMATAGTNIFEDPMSDVTRSRQNYLLLISLVAILVSLTIITPTAGSVVGINFTVNSHISFVLTIVILYFLVVYLISVYQDFKKYRYKNLLSWFALDNLIREEYKELQDLKITDKFEQKSSIVTQKSLAKIKELEDRVVKIQESKSKHLKNGLPWKKGENGFYAPDFTGYIEESDKLLKDLYYYEELSNKITENANRELSELSDQVKKEFDKQTKRLRDVFTIRKDYLMLSGIRLAIEVIFPVVLSLYAIWISLLPK